MSKTNKVDLSKVDLTLIKQFVSGLEESLATADSIKAVAGDKNEYIIEMSKAAGLCAGIMQEAGMLIGDVQAHVMAVQAPSPSQVGGDLLSKFLGPLKGGSGSAN